ncbi:MULTISPECIES: hypothetical protein [Acinetobacter calcoaceticus/baumannii complex]|uniref:hypothetical protein n=1 Tax=Acinetobacter calcoaceticus/baumannii complex TaxID=909768 RepID=UPI000D0B9135|nr:hypothetical protein [Acinetobacter baumannii]EKW0188785.1 hypothetical protein [Acinetobacter baumannii]EKW6255821.1 hypothetical protein [Acinetobacter baumannii]EKW8787413.1 hypothetical protein [Acinetobacter baumannii]ELA6671415.1 hypothetical protein [Acinetobacter baumannii]ELA8723610.1 hypothetical protein [Acinetobacter baumannii]
MIVSVAQDSLEFNINILKAKRNNEAPFKYWLENVLKRGDILPRGKFFKGKTAGKPIWVTDEFWMHREDDIFTSNFIVPPARYRLSIFSEGEAEHFMLVGTTRLGRNYESDD